MLLWNRQRIQGKVYVPTCFRYDGYIPNYHILQRPPFMPERREGQPWIWYSYEQKHYFKMMQESSYLSLFDYKMTYEHDSFVQITYTCPWGSRTLQDLFHPPTPKTSDKLVLLILHQSKQRIDHSFANKGQTGGIYSLQLCRRWCSRTNRICKGTDETHQS